MYIYIYQHIPGRSTVAVGNYQQWWVWAATNQLQSGESPPLLLQSPMMHLKTWCSGDPLKTFSIFRPFRKSDCQCCVIELSQTTTSNMGEPWNIEKKKNIYWTTLKNMIIWGSKSWIPVVTMVLSIEASVEISLGAGRWTCISGPWSDCEMSTTWGRLEIWTSMKSGVSDITGMYQIYVYLCDILWCLKSLFMIFTTFMSDESDISNYDPRHGAAILLSIQGGNLTAVWDVESSRNGWGNPETMKTTGSIILRGDAKNSQNTSNWYQFVMKACNDKWYPLYSFMRLFIHPGLIWCVHTIVKLKLGFIINQQKNYQSFRNIQQRSTRGNLGFGFCRWVHANGLPLSEANVEPGGEATPINPVDSWCFLQF